MCFPSFALSAVYPTLCVSGPYSSNVYIILYYLTQDMLLAQVRTEDEERAEKEAAVVESRRDDI